jgi:hypothetical protein
MPTRFYRFNRMLFELYRIGGLKSLAGNDGALLPYLYLPLAYLSLLLLVSTCSVVPAV